ncbi:phosphonate ABC transporter, permease protein PhnE [Rhodospirillaceae bacterium KN72]|uniref:Phosphonate ABC transporter, permease protein PhnE n=1 Tax=Pacificispira spongiicola TaxID=2729598 RepID=A0A7Y0HF63_9PROT|nr:phosphonate ABC transporter, permease protein PhnE [Pacificispira spongiicola]NMM44243.1 phosphonate ABC transporter, permease protein PhnE [Pacificispira spongiicola]
MTDSTLSIGQLHSHFSEMEKRRRLYTVLFIAGSLIIFFGGFSIAENLNSGGFWQGLSKFMDYPAAIVSDTLNADDWLVTIVGHVPALIETINMAAVSTLFGTLFAMILAFCSSRNLGIFAWIVPIARRLMDITRAFPELIIALFLIYLLGATPIPAIIAVAFHTAGALGKLFSEVNENIDKKPLEGLQATGATWLQRMRFGVLPQVLPNYCSYALLRFEINIRASAILGFVGAGGIGQEFRTAISWGAGDQISALFLLLFLTIVAIDQISSRIRRSLVGGAFQMA